MTSLGTQKGIIEIAKFGAYVTVPICSMYFFAVYTKNTTNKAISNRSYGAYPPEGPQLQSPEELRELAREIARERNLR